MGNFSDEKKYPVRGMGRELNWVGVSETENDKGELGG
jgi:hypothetical protein